MAFDKMAFLAAARQKLAAAKGLMSEADRDEQRAREEGEALLAEALAEARAARDLDLARRLEVAQSKPGAQAMRPLIIQEFDDTFIIVRNNVAHAVFQKMIEEAVAKKHDVTEIKLNYAMEVIYDWNGISDWAPTNQNGINLRDFLTTNNGILMPIVNLALVLHGAFAEERKS